MAKDTESPLQEPESPSKSSSKKKKSSSKSSSSTNKLDESTASLSLDTAEVEGSSSRKSKKKSIKSTKSSSRTAVGEESASSLNASQAQLGESVSEGLTTGASPSGKKSKKKSKKENDESLPDDADTVIQIVTTDLWTADEDASALEALCNVLQGDETARDINKNRQVALELGAHLPVVRKMKDHPTDAHVQAAGLHLVRSWGNLRPTAPWYQLVMVGALERVVQILTVETSTSDLQDNALSVLEQMAADETAVPYLLDHDGIDAMVHVFDNHTDQDVRDRVVQGLRGVMDNGGMTGRKAVAEHVNRWLLNLSDTNRLASALELTAGMAASEEAAKPAIQENIVEGVAHTFRTQSGELNTKALDILKGFISTGGSSGRRALTERTNWILQNSDESKLLVPTIELCTEMVASEDTAKAFVQANGVEGISYAYKMFLEDKPIVPKYAFETLMAVANNGGTAGRQAIVEEGALEAIVGHMQVKPDEPKIQLRGCQMVLALAGDQRKAVKDSGVLPLISQMFSTHRKEKQTLKIAHLAMDAMVK